MKASDSAGALLVAFLFLVGKLLLDPLPSSRPQVPTIVIPSALEFLRPFQRVDRGLKRQTIVLVIAAIGNVDRRHKSLRCLDCLGQEFWQLSNVGRDASRFVLGQQRLLEL